MIRTNNPLRVLATVMLTLVLSGGTAFAQQKEAFTPQRFAELQRQGALVLLDVHADWCSTCAKQQQILADYRKQHPDVPLHTLRIDFDRQKQFVRKFRAPRQSTFILYQGKKQLWFSVAETSPDVIFKELNKAAAVRTR